MSKRNPATASKHAHSPKTAAKAQRAAQAIVRSPKDIRLSSVETGSTEALVKRHNDLKQEAPAVEKPVTALEQEAPVVENPVAAPQQEAPLVENPVTALQDDYKQTITDNSLKKGFDFFSTAANVGAYQGKLLEMAQANAQFAFEFAQRLATIRSPVEFPSVIAEFTGKRIAMFHQHSREMAELSAKR